MTIKIGINKGRDYMASWPVYNEVKAIDRDKRTIEFVASDETIDRDLEVIKAEGWDIKSYKKNQQGLWAHNHGGLPIWRGLKTWIEAGEKKLKTIALFTSEETGNAMGEAIFRLYDNKFLNAVSVGFIGLDIERQDEEEIGGGNKPKIRRTFLKQELLEISAVPVPANPGATIVRDLSEFDSSDIRKELDWMNTKGIVDETCYKYLTETYDTLENRKTLYFPVHQCKHESCEEAKTNGECEYNKEGLSQLPEEEKQIEIQTSDQTDQTKKIELEEKKISGKKGLPLADREASWTASSAKKRVAKWASSDGSGDKDKINWSKFGQAFVVLRNEEESENMGSYALPFADVIEGSLKAVPRGVFAVSAVLMGARGGVDLSDSDRKSAMKFCEDYYGMMDMEAPWQREGRGLDLEAWEIIQLFLDKFGLIKIEEMSMFGPIEEENRDEFKSAGVSILEDSIVKRGAVLSAKNKKKLKEIIQDLENLIMESERQEEGIEEERTENKKGSPPEEGDNDLDAFLTEFLLEDEGVEEDDWEELLAILAEEEE
jgi:hypothetical protein